MADQTVFAGARFMVAAFLLLLFAQIKGWGLRLKRVDWTAVTGLGLSQTGLQYVVGLAGVAAANYGPTPLQSDFTWSGEGSVHGVS